MASDDESRLSKRLRDVSIGRYRGNSSVAACEMKRKCGGGNGRCRHLGLRIVLELHTLVANRIRRVAARSDRGERERELSLVVVVMSSR